MSTQVGFSPNGPCESLMVALINSAQATLDIACYAFTNQAIAQAILGAKNRNVTMRIVFDRSETVQEQAQFYDQFEAAGIPIKLGTGVNGGIMHDKYSIVDATQVENGSFNYTEAAQQNNFENLQIHYDLALAALYTTNFGQIWNLAQPEPVDPTQRMKQRQQRLKAPRPVF